jgi:hypothetical protein
MSGGVQVVTGAVLPVPPFPSRPRHPITPYRPGRWATSRGLWPELAALLPPQPLDRVRTPSIPLDQQCPVLALGK